MIIRYTYEGHRVGMRALTLWQPWAAAIAAGVKLIENRPWLPPKWLYGNHFAIHAGKKFSVDSAETLDALASPQERSQISAHHATDARGAVVAVVRLNVALTDPPARAVFTRNEAAEKWAGEGQARWFFGPFGWALGDVRALAQPVPCRGYQGLWTLPEDVEVEVRRQTGG